MVGERGNTMAQRGPRTGTPIQVYLPDGMKELLVQLAEQNMRKISAEVVIALRRHLAENGLPFQEAGPAPKKSKLRK
jgi:hypothetical protein